MEGKTVSEKWTISRNTKSYLIKNLFPPQKIQKIHNSPERLSIIIIIFIINKNFMSVSLTHVGVQKNSEIVFGEKMGKLLFTRHVKDRFEFFHNYQNTKLTDLAITSYMFLVFPMLNLLQSLINLREYTTQTSN